MTPSPEALLILHALAASEPASDVDLHRATGLNWGCLMLTLAAMALAGDIRRCGTGWVLCVAVAS